MIKTAPTSLKVRQVITDIQNKTLIPRPEFQRRLVWSMSDKNNFIDTLLRGYPFPEIYIADGEVDLETGKGTQLLVDGQQRITTIFEYFTGAASLKLTKEIRPYHNLSDAEKKNFLNYDIAVRNLGIVTKEQIIEIFRRINSTNYSLNDMEVNNALYAGKFKIVCQELAELEFFERHSFFRPMQLRRMGDVKYVASILITMVGGYFNRDDLLEEYLQRYNDEFPEEGRLRRRFLNVISVIEDFLFSEKSRVWKQADFFTLACELDDTIVNKRRRIDVSGTKERLERFYHAVDFMLDSPSGTDNREAIDYQLAALQAANDKSSRIARGRIIREKIVSLQPAAAST
jgi:hypothetical protein